MSKFKINAKIIYLLLLVFAASIFLANLPAQAQSADELYNRAAQKYITGDLVGAESDLGRVLQLNPQHDKARQLLAEIRKELGVSRPPVVPTTTLAPAPGPTVRPTVRPPLTPTVTLARPAPDKAQSARDLLRDGERLFNEGKYKEAEKYFRQVLSIYEGHPKATKYINEIREKLGPSLKVAPPPLPAAPDYTSMEESINQIILLIIAVIIFVLIIAARGGILYYQGCDGQKPHAGLPGL